MRKGLNALALVLALTFAGAGFAAPASTVRTKTSAAHRAAVKKCNDDYREALKGAKGMKGKERKDADAAARLARKQCIANAPK